MPILNNNQFGENVWDDLIFKMFKAYWNGMVGCRLWFDVAVNSEVSDLLGFEPMIETAKLIPVDENLKKTKMLSILLLLHLFQTTFCFVIFKWKEKGSLTWIAVDLGNHTICVYIYLYANFL